MRFILITLVTILILGCSPNSVTDWAFLPPTKGTWKAVKTFGGSEESRTTSIERRLY